MQYKLIQKHNPANRREPAKWYAAPVNNGRITSFQLNRQVIIHNKLDKDMVKKTVNALTCEIIELLGQGYSVNLGRMGTFRISFSSEGVENTDNFLPEMISSLRVIFTPSVELHKKLKETIIT